MFVVHQCLPATCVDLPNESVVTFDFEYERVAEFEHCRRTRDPDLDCTSLVDDVTESGEVTYVDAHGVSHVIHWGKTPSDQGGVPDVIIDVPLVTLPILQCLWIVGVLSGDYPVTAEVVAA